MASYTWVGRIHRAIYEGTGGRIGARLAGIPMLLLTTRGRKSREPRTTPLAYMPDGERFVVFASNNGQDRPPAWWLNLQADPGAQVRAGRTLTHVEARAANPSEREELWPRMIELNPRWAEYPTRTQREIPVVLLEPM